MDLDEYSEMIEDEHMDYLSSSQYKNLWVLNNTIWSMARISFFVLWSARLYSSFKGSIYASHNCVYLLLMIGIIGMFLVLMFVNIVVLALGYVDNNDSVLLALVLTFGILEFMVASSLIFLFVNKLLRLIYNQTHFDGIISAHHHYQRLGTISVSAVTPHPITPSGNSSDSYTVPLNKAGKGSFDSTVGRLLRSASTMSLLKRWQSFAADSGAEYNIKLDAKQMILVNTITQHTLLGVISLISALVYLTIWMTYYFDWRLIKSDFVAFLLITCYTIFDRLIQMLCVYMGMNFAHGLYRKCCQRVHNGCRRLVERTAKRQIKKEVKQRDNDMCYQLLEVSEQADDE